MVSEVVHTGLYNETRRRYDMRVVMASGYQDKPFKNAWLVQFKEGSRVALPPDWEYLEFPSESEADPESDDRTECEADLLKAYDEALTDERLSEVDTTATEQAMVYGEIAKEAYLEKVSCRCPRDQQHQQQNF